MMQDSSFMINDNTDIMFSIAVIEDSFNKLNSNDLHWKLIVIMMHNLLQSLIVSSIRDNGDPTVIYKDVEKRQMHSFLNLFNKIKSEDYLRTPYRCNRSIDDDIESLNKYRNHLIHDDIYGYSVAHKELLLSMLSAFEVMDYLLSSNNHIPSLKKHQKQLARDGVRQLNQKFMTLR